MYGLLHKTNYYKTVSTLAIPQFQKDRDRYADAVDIFKQYCEDTKTTISDILVITDESDPIEKLKKQSWTVYHKFALGIAIGLTNELHRHCKLPTRDVISCRTVIPHEEFVIFYDMRQFITVINPSGTQHRFNPIKPMLINNLQYLPPEVEIIAIYQQLYGEQSERNLLVETKLFEMCASRIKGGKKEQVNNDLMIRRDVFEFLKKLNDVVFINHWARAVILNTDKPPIRDKVQIITTISNVDMLKLLQTKWATVVMTESSVNIPTDKRSGRCSFYIDNIPVLDLCNNAMYNVVPYQIVNHVKVATKYVNLMMLFIDRFILLTLRTVYEDRLRTNWKSIVFFKQHKDIPVDIEYIGVFRDARIDNYLTNLEHIGKFTPYFPEEMLKKTGEYKDFIKQTTPNQ